MGINLKLGKEGGSGPIPISGSTGKIELKRNLKVTNCISLLIAIIIGSGIFISPKVNRFNICSLFFRLLINVNLFFFISRVSFKRQAQLAMRSSFGLPVVLSPFLAPLPMPSSAAWFQELVASTSTLWLRLATQTASCSFGASSSSSYRRQSALLLSFLPTTLCNRSTSAAKHQI